MKSYRPKKPQLPINRIRSSELLRFGKGRLWRGRRLGWLTGGENRSAIGSNGAGKFQERRQGLPQEAEALHGWNQFEFGFLEEYSLPNLPRSPRPTNHHHHLP